MATVLENYKIAVKAHRANAKCQYIRTDSGQRLYRIIADGEILAEGGGIIEAWREADYRLCNS